MHADSASVAALALLASLCLGGCTDVNADRVGDAAMYYLCTTDDECAADSDVAFVCGTGLVVSRDEEDQWGVKDICIPTGLSNDCESSMLESRRQTRAAGNNDDLPGNTCQFPLQCAADLTGQGDEFEGDALGCPLGFARMEETDLCTFVSCDMSVYLDSPAPEAAPPSATLKGLDDTHEGCLEPSVDGPSPFADGEAGRVYCERNVTGDTFTGCPAGWRDALDVPCMTAKAEPYCYLETAVLDSKGVSTAFRSDGSSETMNFVVPYGSAMSCRPLP